MKKIESIEEARKRIENAERELAEARAALLQAEKPKPKQGEVWQDMFLYLIDDEGDCIRLSKGESTLTAKPNLTAARLPLTSAEEGKCLGTFDEVFIERAKVKEIVNRALNLEDGDGDSLFSCTWKTGIPPECYVIKKAVEILDELTEI